MSAGLMLDATGFHRHVPRELKQDLAEWLEARCEDRPVIRAELLGEGRLRCWTFLRGFYDASRCDDTVWLDTHHWHGEQLWRDQVLLERCFYVTDQPPPALLAAFFAAPSENPVTPQAGDRR